MRYVYLVSIIVMVLAQTGCLAWLMRDEDKLYTAAEFSTLATHMEAQVPNLASAKTSELFYLCESYAKLKQYNKLFPCLDQMERNIHGGDVQQIYVEGWIKRPNNISYYPWLARATAYVELGNFRGAVMEGSKAYERAKNLKGRAYGPAGTGPSDARVKTAGVVALAYALAGDRDNAKRFIKVLEDIETPRVAVMPFQERKAFELAKAYMAVQEFELARTVSGDPPGTAKAEMLQLTVGTELMRVHALPRRFIHYKSNYELGRVPEAKEGYDKLLSQPQTQTNGEIYWLILFDRGRIAEGESSRQQAIGFYKKAIDVIEQQRSTINTEASRIGFVGDKQQVYHRLVAALVAEGQPAQAFEYVERAKARALVDLLASKQDFSAPAGAPSVQVAMLVKDWDQIEEDSRVPVASSEESGRRRARGVQVKANLRAVSPELASLVMVTETTSTAIQALLESDETLLEYYYQGDDLYTFVVMRDRIQGVKLNGANVAKEIEAFRKALEDPKSDRAGESSRTLYARLIQPVAAQIGTKRVLVVGHGVLHYLPFAALSDGAGYLVDRYSLRLLPSASVLQFLKGRQAQKSGSLLAFGNPDLGDPQYDLKFAQDEVQAIAKTFPQAKVLVRKEATKGAFRSLAPQFSYLHLATHGQFDPDAPLKSGLLLAKDAQGDGFLSLGDLYSLRLNADLVTLSACETGLGKVSNGDDVVGLTRGFLYAGSSSIVASLWEVDDRATSLLMTELYSNLKQTDKREALRRAQLTTKKQYPHPFYWAAFQLTGMP